MPNPSKSPLLEMIPLTEPKKPKVDPSVVPLSPAEVEQLSSNAKVNEQKLIKRQKRRKAVQADMDRMSNAFIETVAALPDLKLALSVSDSSKAQDFLADLVSIKRKGWTVTALARKNGLSVKNLLDIFRDFQLSKGLIRVVEGIEPVSKDVVADARSRIIYCEYCNGYGKRPTLEQPPADENGVVKTQYEPCKPCNSTGLSVAPGDAESRKLMFKTVGWIDKRPLVHQGNTNITVNNVESVIAEIERKESDGGLGMVVDSLEDE